MLNDFTEEAMMTARRHTPPFALLVGFLALGASAADSGCSASSPVMDPPPPGFSAGGGPGGGPCTGNGPCGFGGGGSSGGVSRPIAPQPTFGSTVTADVAPPPISGGTLLVTKDGSTAVAADPDRDAVYVVDMAAASVAHTVALQPGDEPGRVAEDGAGRVHVALRSGGALVTIDPSTGTVLARRNVCPAPRGVAWDKTSDLVWVACATGELVALPAAGGMAMQSYVVERDLRDVVVEDDGSLLVSTFRSATVLHIQADGTVASRDTFSTGGFANVTPQVAWRTIAGASAGSTVTVFQAESSNIISTHSPGGYGGGGGPGRPPLDAGIPPGGPAGGPFSPIVESAVAFRGPSGVSTVASLPEAVLPVDVAISPVDSSVAVVAAGNAFSSLGNIWRVSGGNRVTSTRVGVAQPIAAAFDANNDLVVQSREPAALSLTKAGMEIVVGLSSDTRRDTGHDIFHTQAGALIACASCHPEGGDDGHVWLLEGLPRRSPSLRGTIAGTAPYHWPGDEATMSALVDDVYTGRMSGARLDTQQHAALSAWVESIPAPPAPSWVDADAAQRGQALFQSSDTGCATCHSGPKLTNNATVDVGTGTDHGVLPDGGAVPTAFQVPPLVGVGWRTPLLHNGCAATIGDRFGKCASVSHGTTSKLSAQDVSDLTAYLDSL